MMDAEQFGTYGKLDEGPLKGRRFVVPRYVFVEKGNMGGVEHFAKACIKHGRFIPDNGCPECADEKAEADARKPIQ